MRHSRTTGQGARAAAFTLMAGLALGGCSSLGDHNDVLLFGTDTKFALDVSADATSGGTPSVTLGYKRKEAVWMPLLTNGPCRNPSPPAYCSDPKRDTEASRYIGSAGEAKDARKDAYSVFASFGANLKGDANGSAHATVGLAQFFATGIAAQKLAENPQAANVLSVQPEATGKAIAEAGATLTPEEIAARNTRETISVEQQGVAERAAACVKLAPTGGAAIAAKLPATANAKFKSDITTAKTANDFRLIIDQFSRSDLEAAVKATCSTN